MEVCLCVCVRVSKWCVAIQTCPCTLMHVSAHMCGDNATTDCIINTTSNGPAVQVRHRLAKRDNYMHSLRHKCTHCEYPACLQSRARD